MDYIKKNSNYKTVKEVTSMYIQKYLHISIRIITWKRPIKMKVIFLTMSEVHGRWPILRRDEFSCMTRAVATTWRLRIVTGSAPVFPLFSPSAHSIEASRCFTHFYFFNFPSLPPSTFTFIKWLV